MNRRHFLAALATLPIAAVPAVAARPQRAYRWDCTQHCWQEVAGFPRTPGAILYADGWTCIAVVQADGSPEYIGLPREIFAT